MNFHRYDYDELPTAGPSSPQDHYYPSFPQASHQIHSNSAPRRPWSPEHVNPDYGSDGGAIARYLERQERGQPAVAAQVHRNNEWGMDGDRRWDGANDGYETNSYGHERWHADGGRHRRERRERREASGSSVDALDLADYSGTLGRRAAAMEAHSSPGFQRRVPPVDNSNETYSRYPTPATINSRVAFNLNDTAPVDRPFSAQSLQSRGTHGSNRSIGSPPSLVSAREGLATLSTTSRSAGRSSPRSPPPHAFAGNNSKRKNNQRHISLPPAFPTGPRPGEPMIFAATAGSVGGHSTHSDPFHQAGDYDVTRFPKWSRDWYSNTPNGTKKNTGTTFPMVANNEPQEADLGIWPPQAAPTYPTYPYSSQSPQSSAHDVGAPSPVPWGSSASHLTNPDGLPQYVPDTVKEERMRMLEREFGNKNGKGKERIDDGTQVGSVDDEGALITSGPRRRSAVRWTQTILACGGAAAGIYGALAIHPKTPAPPAGKPPAYVLYVLSVATFLFMAWFFHIRPCMRRRKRRKNDKYTQNMNPAGMMVLPIVQGLGGKGKKKKGGDMAMGMGGPPGKKGKKGKGGAGPGQGVQVNLIVDPTMFGGNGTGRGSRRKGGYGEEDDVDDEYQPSDEERSTTTRSNGPRRRGIYQGLQLEQDWKAARKRLKWQIFVDILLMIIWAAAAFYVLWGARCPPGGFEGWYAPFLLNCLGRKSLIAYLPPSPLGATLITSPPLLPFSSP